MPAWEICVAAYNFGPGRAQEGDIIVARLPTGIIGAKEGRDFLWMTIETDLSKEELEEEGEGSGPTEKKRKRKLDMAAFCVEEAIDKRRVNNPGDEYQPLLGRRAMRRREKHIKDKSRPRGRPEE